MAKGVINTSEACNFPNGYTLSDNRIEDFLQKLLSPSAYVVWRQYLRYWGGDKSTAYPSLALVSKKTGLSEKTIRKCNRELCDKGYMQYTQGCSNRSNQYHYISIDSLMGKYYDEEEPSTETVPQPIKEIAEDKRTNAYSLLKDLKESDKTIAKSFIEEFKQKYREKFGVQYGLEKADIKELVKCVGDIKDQFQVYTMLLQRYFTSSNEFLQSSDFSLFFFLQSKTKKLLVAECNKTNIGRWIGSAEKELEKLKKLEIDKDIDSFLAEHIHLSGANSERDKFVLDYLRDSLQAKI